MINELDWRKTLKEDLKKTAESDLPWDEFRNKTILVTGASGLIGSNLVKTLIYCTNKHQLNMKVIATGRSMSKLEKIFSSWSGSKTLKLVAYDVTEGPEELNRNVPEEVDYVIHGASITNSALMISKPVETIQTSVFGTSNLLEFCRIKRVKRAVYISSMEMYGDTSVFEENGEGVREDKIGLLDPLAIRSDYPESKRLCENMCIAYNSEYSVPISIVRLAQSFGPGILEEENRVFAQLARCVLENRDFVMHTTGQSEGNYCYLQDAVKGILMILSTGKSGEAYNVVNEECHMTIAEMAEMVCNNVAQKTIHVVYDLSRSNQYGYAKPVKLKLSADKIRELGWKPAVGLEEAYRRLILDMKETAEMNEIMKTIGKMKP